MKNWRGATGLLVFALVFASVAAADTLVEQAMSSTDMSVWAAQDFETAFDAYDCFVADDFVVPAGATWLIETIKVWGGCWNGGITLMNATSLNCYIFEDTGGLPDGIPAGYGGSGLWNESWAPTDANVTIFSDGTFGNCCWEVNVNAQPALEEGTYWLACYPKMDFSAGGQWGIHPSDTTNGAVGKWINPGGGFGYGTAWQNWTILGGTKPDQAIGLYGTAGYAPEVNSIDPSEGTNDGVVSVTITGDHFIDGDTDVKLSGPAKAEIEGTNVTVVNEQTLTCDFDLTDAAAGLYDVVVATSFGTDTLDDGFEVTEPSDDDTDDDAADDDTGGDDEGGCGC